MKPFHKHCAILTQLFRPVTAMQRRTSVRQPLNLIFTICLLFCLFQQTATAQAFHIPEPTPPPAAVSAALELDTTFYRQWIDVSGLPVLASANVSPYAVKEAAYLIYKMIGHRPDMLRAMGENKERFSIIAHNELLTQIPEYNYLQPHYYHDIRGRGLGSAEPNFTTSCPEENLLRYPGTVFPTGSILMHEFAHAIHERGLRLVDPGFDKRLNITYQAAMENGLWDGTYAQVNRQEYWAEGSEAWLNPKYPMPPDAPTQVEDPRDALKRYDPRLAALLTEIYGDGDWRLTPVATRTHHSHLQGFDPQNTPTFQYPPDAVALYEELTNDPDSTGDGRWINLAPYPSSELPRLQASRRKGAPTLILFGNYGTDDFVHVYWVGPDGTEHPRGRLRHDMKPYETYVGELWMVKDENDEILGVYRAEAETGRILVTKEYKGPKVNIPDLNLAAAVRKELRLTSSTPITQEALEALTGLGAGDQKIKNLTGLEYATGLVELSLWNNQIKDVAPLAKLTQLQHLHLQANQITDITPLAGLTQLEHLHLWGNQIRDISVLTGLTELKSLWLSGNPIQDMSPLWTLLKRNPDLELDIDIDKTPATDTNPDLTAAGPKIEGPWLWMLVPTGQKTDAKTALREDFLAAASNDSVTEAQIAINGATEGDRVGNKVWTLGKLPPISGDNINEVMNAIGLGKGYIDYHVAYGLIFLDSPQEQNTWMYAGSDDNHKVWLNGKLVHEQLNWHWAHDYQESFQVTLKKGKNVLLVAVEDGAGAWSGFFGFEKDAVYRILPPPLREDVNKDNIVNILDLTFVAANFGKQGKHAADVNGDNIVNILDLTLVAAAFGNTAAAGG